MSKCTTLTVCALTVALSLAACGGGTKGGKSTSSMTNENQVRATVSNYQHAVARGDGTSACALMTPNLRHLTAGSNGSCEGVVAKVHSVMTSEDIQVFLAAHVVRVQVAGSTAIAEIESGARTTSAHLRKLGRSWLLDVSGPATR
jgi:hypothetical protein